MTVLLYTDAGVDQRTGCATWATVAILPDVADPVEASGRLRDDTLNSTTAELRAIANALHRLIRRGDLKRGDSVRLFTDSHHAVERIEGRSTKRPNSTMGKATLVIAKLVEVHGIALKAAWIPGHKPDAHSPHARWNNRCDALCRAARELPRPSSARKALDRAKRLAGVSA